MTVCSLIITVERDIYTSYSVQAVGTSEAVPTVTSGEKIEVGEKAELSRLSSACQKHVSIMFADGRLSWE